MITVEDLRNPARKSGFNNVDVSPSGSRYRGRAGHTGAGVKTNAWRGSWFKSAQEAAEDFCNYRNGAGAAVPKQLKSAGHGGKREALTRDPEVEAALGVLRDAKAQRDGRQGYVYLIAEDLPGGGLRYGKVGYSVNPQKRVAELQTGNPRPLKLLYAMPAAPEDEARLHQKYIHDNVLQEWFRITKDLLLEFPAETSCA